MRSFGQGSRGAYFCAFNKLEIALATNRNLQDCVVNSVTGVTDLFGGEFSRQTYYGLAEVWIQDLSQDQAKESRLKRVWRLLSPNWNEFRERRGRVLVPKIELKGKPDFIAYLRELTRNGALITVHGYANSFDHAIHDCARVLHQAGLDRLQLLPIVFSWPSRGKIQQYLPDENAAENSVHALQDFLSLLARAAGGREVDVMAHSHGGKILVSSLTQAKRSEDADSCRLKRLILVASDLDQEWLNQRVDTLAKVIDQIVIYHSANDRALSVTSFLFDSIRVGQHGLPVGQSDAHTADRVEVIDASRIAKGLAKHTPHLDCPEVMSDIYHLLRGMKPHERFHLRPLDVCARCWQITPSDL